MFSLGRSECVCGHMCGDVLVWKIQRSCGGGMCECGGVGGGGGGKVSVKLAESVEIGSCSWLCFVNYGWRVCPPPPLSLSLSLCQTIHLFLVSISILLSVPFPSTLPLSLSHLSLFSLTFHLFLVSVSTSPSLSLPFAHTHTHSLSLSFSLSRCRIILNMLLDPQINPQWLNRIEQEEMKRLRQR